MIRLILIAFLTLAPTFYPDREGSGCPANKKKFRTDSIMCIDSTKLPTRNGKKDYELNH